ncbi:hypothetical protein L9F63_017637, partial [Diploptera punctata]
NPCVGLDGTRQKEEREKNQKLRKKKTFQQQKTASTKAILQQSLIKNNYCNKQRK